jgi:hypothetical protein
VVDKEPRLVIDPTKNVLDLVEAERKHRDTLRDADASFQNAMREAESRRVNELATQKQIFDIELAKVLRANQDAASTLLATQLKEVKNDISDRTAKLEQFRYETSGKSSGNRDIWGWLFGGISLVIAAGTFFILVLRGKGSIP